MSLSPTHQKEVTTAGSVRVGHPNRRPFAVAIRTSGPEDGDGNVSVRWEWNGQWGIQRLPTCNNIYSRPRVATHGTAVAGQAAGGRAAALG